MKHCIMWLLAIGNFIKDKSEIGSMYFIKALFLKLAVTPEVTI